MVDQFCHFNVHKGIDEVCARTLGALFQFVLVYIAPQSTIEM
jgi:hypothetical protein